MNKDPVLEEMHDTRAKLLEEFGSDLTRLMDYLKTREIFDHDRLVHGRPGAPGRRHRGQGATSSEEP